MPPVVRKGDSSTGDPCGAGPRGCSGSASKTYANNKLIHRRGDAWIPHACPLSPPHGASTSGGSPNVIVEGSAVARVGDGISCGSKCNQGSPNVYAN